jgi:hypothetical protein
MKFENRPDGPDPRGSDDQKQKKAIRRPLDNSSSGRLRRSFHS